MGTIVCKFGGSSVASAQQFQKIKGIVEMDPKRRVVVCSAPGKRVSEEAKVTDLLLSCHELALKKLNFDGLFEDIKERYTSIHRDLGLDFNLEPELEHIKESIKIGESKDYVASRGEYLCALLMANYLKAEFVDAKDYIHFDHMGRVSPETYGALGKKLSEGDKLFVLPGFYGVDSRGRIKTFSRGGSDISGAIAARAIHAELYENWTDVSGLLMADPRIVANPLPMDQVTYREIRELAYMGANVFHDEAIAPVKELKIPIQIKNTNKPQDKGTTILHELAPDDSIIAGIAGKEKACIFHIEKPMMNKEKGFGRKVLGIFESHDVNYEHSPTGIDSMSVVVLQEELKENEDAIVESITRIMQPENVTVSYDLSLIAIVGEGMNHQVGVAASVFDALRDNEINVRIIDQGSSEVNIIVGVQNSDYKKAINCIYEKFVSVSAN